MIDKNEKTERVLLLWLQNVSEEKIAAVMDMTVEEVHNIIYIPSYFNSWAEFLEK
jgi:hypothetical protein